MSEQIPEVGYMLLFRGTDWDENLSPQATQEVMARWMEWFEGLKRDGRAASGHPLAREGRVVSGAKGRGVSDGPFAESKEAIGGYFMLKVADLDEAVEIARQCPALEHGLTVEVRPVIAQCVMQTRLNELLAGASA